MSAVRVKRNAFCIDDIYAGKHHMLYIDSVGNKKTIIAANQTAMNNSKQGQQGLL